MKYNIWCKIFRRHKLVADSGRAWDITGSGYCGRKGCEYKYPAVKWPPMPKCKPPKKVHEGLALRELLRSMLGKNTEIQDLDISYNPNESSFIVYFFSKDDISEEIKLKVSAENKDSDFKFVYPCDEGFHGGFHLSIVFYK